MPNKPEFDLTTLGEILLRQSVPPGQRLETASHLDIQPAGAEANVAVALSRLGRSCGWVGGLPQQAIGRLVTNHLRLANVNLDGVVWCQNKRLGTYYIEFTGPPRPVTVIYDRADSCTSNLSPKQINWDYLLNSRLLHLTGITPALSESCRQVVIEAITRAKTAGVPISFDINYRAKLWSEREAKTVLTPLIQNIDLLFCGQADASRIFGINGSPEQVVDKLAAKSRAKNIVVTLGDKGVVAWDGQAYHYAEALPVQIIDRLGAGDALAAGVIHGWLDNDLNLGVRYGVTLAALALSQHGDFLVTTEEEVLSLLDNAEGGVNR